jgi:hypothetical protein
MRCSAAWSTTHTGTWRVRPPSVRVNVYRSKPSFSTATSDDTKAGQPGTSRSHACTAASGAAITVVACWVVIVNLLPR